MTANQLKHQAKLEEWAEAIQECRSSDMSVREWCRNRGTTTTTYYRWERQLLSMASGLRSKPQQLAAATTFAELPVPQQQCRTVAQQAATVHVNDIAIDIYPSMDAELLKILLKTTRSC